MKMLTAIILAAQVMFAFGQVVELSAETQCVPHQAPTNLTAVGLESDVIHLQWTPGDNSGVGFKIERSMDGVVWERINCGYANGHYNDTYELQPSTTYYFRVAAFKCGGKPSCVSGYSNIATATTTADDTDGE